MSFDEAGYNCGTLRGQCAVTALLCLFPVEGGKNCPIRLRTALSLPPQSAPQKRPRVVYVLGATGTYCGIRGCRFLPPLLQHPHTPTIQTLIKHRPNSLALPSSSVLYTEESRLDQHGTNQYCSTRRRAYSSPLWGSQQPFRRRR